MTEIGETIAVAERDRAPQDGRKVILGMRPEHLRLAQGVPGFSAQVVVTEPTGSEVQVLAKHGGDDCRSSLFRERFQPAPGETLTLTPDPAHVASVRRRDGSSVCGL